MIIGYNMFGYEHGGSVWDTPVCTDMMDELIVSEGTYDHIRVDLNTSIPNTTVINENWDITTVLNAGFNGDLDAGSIGAEGFTVTDIMMYRTVSGSDKWEPLTDFAYDPDYNLYEYIDRYVQNGTTYQYAIVPVANNVQGDMLKSDDETVRYEGIFLTDKNDNKRLEFDIELGDITHNTSSAVLNPIDSVYPMIVTNQMRYRTGTLTTLPLSKATVAMHGADVDGLAEQLNRERWIDFLTNGKAKVLRMDSGVSILVQTSNPVESHKEGRLRDLASISFDYTEFGKLNFDNMEKNDLVASPILSKTTFNDDGGIING